MTESEKQLTEQVAGIAVIAADLPSMIISALVGMKTIGPSEAITLMEALSTHTHDLSRRNADKFPGMSVSLRNVADRLDEQTVVLKKDIAEHLPRG